MKTRTVTYTTIGPVVSCEQCLPAAVILAAYPALVLNAYDDLKGFVEAQLIAVTAVVNGARIYTFEYDETLLASVDISLGPSDILGFFCKGLREEWIIDLTRRAT